MELAHLAPLPTTIRTLLAPESERLQQLYPYLPKGLDQCVTCRGTKRFTWYDDYSSADRQIVEYECPCADQFILHKFLLHCGVGKRDARTMWPDIEGIDESNLEWVLDYIENLDYYIATGIGLKMEGRNGTGKSLIAKLLMKRIIANGVEGHFTTFSNMLDTFTQGWRSDEKAEWFRTTVTNAPILVVDDIGREHSGRASVASSALDAIFRERVQNALPTIITTNLSAGQFKDTYSTAVMSLLTEVTRSAHFDGEDWRPKQMARQEFEVKNRLTRPISLG